MCDINCIWLFNLLVAVVLILLQQQQHVVGSKQVQQHHQQLQQLQQRKYISPYDGISSYASAAAANYLRRTSSSSSQPHHVVKREIKNDKNTDFISYLNDFNMQDETSIPEDIIDQQHLQEIIDKQQQGLQLEQQLQQKYVGESSAAAAAEAPAGSSIVNGDNDDIIDVNLPYDDSSTDTDSDADIILESQRSSERSDDNKNNNNNSNNSKNIKTSNNNDDDDSEEDVEMVAEEKTKKNLKKTNNKKEMFKERKTFKNTNSNNDNKNQEKKKQQQQIKYENNIDYSNQYNMYGDVQTTKSLKDNDSMDDASNVDDDEDEDKFELDYEDDDDGSAEYEKFKSMHEQKQREKQQQQQQQQQKQKEQVMSTLKTIINDDDETFSRPDSNEEMTNNRDNDKIKHMADYTDDNNNKNIKNLNDYEIFHQHLLEQKQKLLQRQQQQKQQLNQPKEDAIGDIEETENPNIFKTNSYSNSNNNNNNNDNESKNKNNNNFANIFIPRKMKRHNGAARLDDATNRYTKLKQEQLQQQQQLNSQINTEGNHPDAVAKVSSQEENFKKKYYDILKENSTSTSDHHLQQQQQKHHHHPSGESNPKDFSFYDENTERESTHEVKKQTAFEKEKSLRRNNKRYGHKTHKKKYKDYLRYSQIMMMTTTSTPPNPSPNPTSKAQQTPTKNAINMVKDNQDPEVADLNFLRDKHVKKFKLEKIKSLIPPAPIFVLKPREEKENNKEDLREMEKVEEPTTKPFYEGQINYFLETPDDDSERANEVRFITKGERMDTNDWYRKLSPVLRNGNKKINPIAEERSGIGVGRSRGGYTPYHHYRPQHHGQLHHGQTRNHHYHQQHHHQQQQQHARQPHHHQALKHSRHHAYQRKMIPKRLVTTTTPMPPPSRKQMVNANGIGELGHQITDIKDLERYYAKWPHLAKVQSQLHEEQMREQQSENYPDYEYDNDDYFEENDNKDDNLPPYIRKFNRRNKQLLDLLEGTIAPPTKAAPQLRWSGSKLQPGPRDSSVGSMSVRIDDDYLKEKRKRYHQRQRQIHDLFAQQRTTTTTTQPPPYPYVNVNGGGRDGGGAAEGVGDEITARQYTHTENHLPDEDVSISLESNEQENEFGSNSAKQESGGSGGVDETANDDSKSEQEIWQKEIETKSANMAAGNLQITNWQMEKLITSTPVAATATTKKSAIHKLPSYPSIAGGYMNRPRSRSAQFAPSSGSEFRRVPLPYLNNLNNNDNINNNNNFINAGGFVAYNKAPVVSKTINGRFSANTPNDYNNNKQQQQQQSVSNTTTTSPDAAKTQSSSSSSNNHLIPPSSSSSSSSAAPSSSVTNSFIYHRVVDASPRLVGAGFIPGRKQRLPFVAITDRRLETSKKSLTDHQKDFEQNHYPLP